MKQGWEIKKLGEVCEIFDNLRKPVAKKDRINGIYPYYGATGLQDYVDSYIFDDRYLLIGEDGAKWGAGDVTAFIIEGKCWVNNHAHIVKTYNLIDTFAAYYLNYSDLSHFITGAVVPKLTQQAMREIPIPVPPLAEQERIVTELDLLSSIIEKKKAQLAELDTLCQSIFYEMFGDPIINEKGWEIKKLGEVCKTMSGGTPKSDVKDYYNGNIPWLRSGEINTLFITGTELTISELGLQKSSAKWIPINSVAIAMYGATVGQVGIIKQRMTTNQAICSILPNEVVNSIFLCFYLHSLKPQFIKDAIGGAQANISQDLIRKTTIILPPLQLQQTFADKITAIEQQKSIIRQSLTETQTLFNSRMSHYFD